MRGAAFSICMTPERARRIGYGCGAETTRKKSAVCYLQVVLGGGRWPNVGRERMLPRYG